MEQDLLVIGLESSGKTLLIRRLQSLNQSLGRGRNKVNAHFSTEVVPTIGVDVVSIKNGRKKYCIREVGGVMKPLWSNYLKACTAILFVVDTSDYGTIARASVAFLHILCDQTCEMKPVYLILNKVDAPLTVPPPEIENIFLLNPIKQKFGPRLRLFTTSGMSGEGVAALWHTIVTKSPRL